MPGRKRDQRLDDAIVAAALALIGEQGYQRLSMEAVAARVGVPKSTVYKRWPNRAQLASGAVSRRLAEMTAGSASGGDPHQRLAGLLEEEIAFAATPEGRAVAHIVLGHLENPAGGGEEVVHELQARRSRIRAAIVAGRDLGLWATPDADLAVDLMMGAAWVPLLVGRTEPAPTASAILDAVLGPS